MFIVAEYFLDFLVLEGHPDSIILFFLKWKKQKDDQKQPIYPVVCSHPAKMSCFIALLNLMLLSHNSGQS